MHAPVLQPQPTQPRGDGDLACRRSRLLAVAMVAETPALLLDPTVVVADYARLQRAFRDVGADRVQTFFALKANPHPALLRAVAAAGCGMDVASGPETTLALQAGVPPERLCFSAPFKREGAIADAHGRGVRLFVADSAGEVEKIARHAPGARLLVRVAVPGGQALSPMGDKFGADPDMVIPLLAQAKASGLVPWGLHFHVGSQCLEAAAWARAIAAVAPLWHAARAHALPLTVLDIGGGFPARYGDAVPSVEAIARIVLLALREHRLGGAGLAVEPGRWLLRHAAMLVATVIGRACRGGEEWAYLDVGIYNGLMEARDGIVYPLRTLDELASGKGRPRRRVTLAGPSCDGTDVLWRGVEAPALAVGDRVLLFGTGAYTTAYERFNGLAFPMVVPLAAGESLAQTP